MQYKGEDLDLRVPHVRASRDFYASEFEHAGNGRWSRMPSLGIANNEPVWVDETLLACCNYAFDVAQANGAAEVNLEHLVNALTRVEAAARLLESRGVREGYLRRESAALIASEVPAANAGDAVSPRRSSDFEDVLRRASDVAHRRSAPAGVDDVVWVLLHYSRDLPVVQLLRRLTPDWQRLEWSRLREPPMPEPASRPVAVQLLANDGAHARIASIEDGLRLMQSEFAAERKLLMDLVRDIQRDLIAQRNDGAAFHGDLGQRLGSVERALSTRSEPRAQTLLADRLTHLEQTLQGSLAESARGTRELSQRLGVIENAITDVKAGTGSDIIGERLAALEKAVHGGLGEGARNWANLGQRLSTIEENVGARLEAPSLEAVGERIASLQRVVETSLAEGARNFGQLGERLNAFEASVGGDGTSRSSALEPRLAAIEQRLRDTGSEAERRQGEVVAHLAAVSQTLETGRSEATRLQNDMADRLSIMETYLAETPVTAPANASNIDTSELSERLSALERVVRTGFGDAATAMGQIAQRLVAVERSTHDRPHDAESMLILEDRLGALDSRGQQALSASSEIIQRLRALEQRPIAQGDATIDTAALVTPIEQKLAALENVNVSRVDEMQSAVSAISTRLEQLDERMRADMVVTEEALRGRDQDFDFIYNEIKEVAQSQATLNSAVSDWRTESQEHFSALANRLDRLQAPAPLRASVDAPPVPNQAADIPIAIKPREGSDVAPNGSARKPEPAPISVTADDYGLPPEPGRGFVHWLFGTSRVASANRTNKLELTRMRDNIRETRERRRTEV